MTLCASYEFRSTIVVSPARYAVHLRNLRIFNSGEREKRESRNRRGYARDGIKRNISRSSVYISRMWLKNSGLPPPRPRPCPGIPQISNENSKLISAALFPTRETRIRRASDVLQFSFRELYLAYLRTQKSRTVI